MNTRRSRFRPALLLSVFAVAGACVFQVACSDDDNAVKETIDSGNPVPPTDSSVADSGQTSDATLTDADCFLNPTTHVEIINACTDASRITKNPTLPLLLADGGLPPIP